MELTIKRENFLKPLQLVFGAVERKQISPILSNVMLVAEGDRLSVIATDLEIELIGEVTLDSPVISQGETTASARKLIDICKTLPEKAEIKIRTEKERLLLRSGRSNFTLTTLPTIGFPALEGSKSQVEFSLPQSKLKKLINKIHFSMAQGDVRYYLNGMSFDFEEGTVKLVAADGHRLSLTSFSADNIPAHRMQVVVPQKGIIELIRLLEDTDTEATFKLGPNYIRVSAPGFTFTSKLIDVKCPNYSGAIPKGGDKIMIIDRDLLKQALIRVSILSNEKYRGIRLLLTPGLLKLSANNPEQEEAEEEIEIDYQGSDLEIGFNANYLRDICNAVTTDNIKMVFSNSNDGVLIEGIGEEGEYVYIVMPLQL